MKKLLNSFGYAAKGIWAAIQQEQNMRVHLVAAFYVLLFSMFYGFTSAEKCILFLAIGGVMGLELVNSALERAVDKPDPAHFMAAGTVKDMAAGAVLVFSIAAAACGVTLFWRPAVFPVLLVFFTARPLALVALVATLPLSILFIFKKER